MAGSNFSDPKSNDLARSFPAPSAGNSSASERENVRLTPGVGGQEDSSQATPEAKRAGYGYSFVGENDHPSGGHNLDARNQYTVKLPRGSSI